MKRHLFLTLPLALVLATLPAAADEKNATSSSSSSSSSTSTSYTDENGNTVTTTTTERDGKRETRRTVTGPGGKVISESNGDADGAKPGAKPAAEKGKPGGPWLGVHTAELPPAMREQLDLPAGTGLLVEQLPPDSPARNAGIAQHDILLTFNLTPVSTPEELRAELAKCRPGEKALIEFLHKSRPQKAAVTLGKRGDAQSEQQANEAEPAPKGADAGAKPDKRPGKAADAGANPKLPGFPALPHLPAIPNLPKLPGANGDANGHTTTSTNSSSFSRTVIVGPDGQTRVIENKNGGGDPIEQMLRDPNVPETMKESLRKMQHQMRDFQKRSGAPEPSKPKAGKGEAQ